MNTICKIALKTIVRNVVFQQQYNAIASGSLLGAAKFSKTDFLEAKEKKLAQKLASRISPKITLIAKDESLSIVSLAEAQKLAKRRDLKLVKILDLDTKTKRAIYKLMTGAEYHIEDLKRREEKKEAKKVQTIKGEKLLSLSSKISEHDLNAKLAMTLKWLHKLYEVRVVISVDGSDSQKAEQVAATLEKNTTDVGKIVQKRVKDASVKFQIMPIIKKDEPKLLDASSTNDPQKEHTAMAMHTDAGSGSS